MCISSYYSYYRPSIEVLVIIRDMFNCDCTIEGGADFATFPNIVLGHDPSLVAHCTIPSYNIVRLYQDPKNTNKK